MFHLVKWLNVASLPRRGRLGEEQGAGEPRVQGSALGQEKSLRSLSISVEGAAIGVHELARGEGGNKVKHIRQKGKNNRTMLNQATNIVTEAKAKHCDLSASRGL